MYFSRIRIETGSLARVKLLNACQNDLYNLHQLIWKMFPGNPEGNRSFLFRQEFEKEQLSNGNTQRGMPLFYLVSKDSPIPIEGLLTVDLKQYNPKIKNGDRFCFKLRVNPVISRKTEGKKYSVKHDVLMDAKYHAKADGITDPEKICKCMNDAVIRWLLKKEKSSGFQLDNPEFVEISAYRQHLLKKKGLKEIRFSSVDITGVLKVTDSVSMEKTLFNGIGSSKAFGCGLMLIKPV